MRRLRPTLRLRLTLLYGGLLVGVGAVLIVLSYVLVSRTLNSSPKPPAGSVAVVEDTEGDRFLYDARQLVNSLISDAQGDLLRRGLIALALVSAVGIAGGYLLAGRALRPLKRVTATAHRLSTETLDERIALQGPDDELKELADTFDGMLGRLEAAFDRERRFVANASHELRTPLSVMRTEVDVTLADPDASVTELRQMGVVVREATERAHRLVDALLLLARTDAQARDGLQVREHIDLPTVADSALEAVRREVEAHHLRVAATLDPAPVRGDAGLLERLAGNLVENAVRHNVDGGWLSTRTGVVDGWSQLAVASSGPVLRPEEVDGLFEPFRRGGTARTATRGAGLGLSIVRSVALAHGGTVTGRALPDGGLEVVASLPHAAP